MTGDGVPTARGRAGAETTDGNGAVGVLLGLRRIFTLGPVERGFIIGSRSIRRRSEVGLVGMAHPGKLPLVLGDFFLLTLKFRSFLVKTVLVKASLLTALPFSLTSVSETVLFRRVEAAIARDGLAR